MSLRSQPAYDAVAVNVSATDDALVTRGPCDALYIGTAGNVVLETLGGRSATFVAVVAGSVLPVSATKIIRTGTTAANILALYTGG